MTVTAPQPVADWDTSRYSVPWTYAGKQVWVRDNEDGMVEVRCGNRRIAHHEQAFCKHEILRKAEQHHGIPVGVRQPGKTLIHIRSTAPVAEIRPLSA